MVRNNAAVLPFHQKYLCCVFLDNASFPLSSKLSRKTQHRYFWWNGNTAALLWPCNIECTNCKALHWKLEETTKSKYNKCYRGGDVLLDRVKPLPPFLASLIERTAQPNSLVKTFFRKIRWLNSSASFASCKWNF